MPMLTQNNIIINNMIGGKITIPVSQISQYKAEKLRFQAEIQEKASNFKPEQLQLRRYTSTFTYRATSNTCENEKPHPPTTVRPVF